MRTQIKNLELDHRATAHIAYLTCQWWDGVFIQAERFFSASANYNGEFPWEKNWINSTFLMERLFLITSIHHALEYTEKLNIDFKKKNDFYFQKIIDEINRNIPIKDIYELRNMNEHEFDYFIGMGDRQQNYKSTVFYNSLKVETSANITFIDSSKNIFIFGNVNISKLLEIMKTYLPFIQKKTEEIFLQNFH